MLVEFDTVRSCAQESFEIEKQADIGGEFTINFLRKRDYQSQVAVDMDKIVDFTGGKVWFNEKELECVYLYLKDGAMSPNILIGYSDFKKVFEFAKGVKISRHEEV